MVTSSNPSEGKTTYAFNLRFIFGKNQTKFCLLKQILEDHQFLNGFYQFDKEIFGLGEIITGTSQLKDTIFKVPGTELDINYIWRKKI